MKIFLSLLLGAPATALAQQAPVLMLQGSANPHGYFLTDKVLLYRHLRDTASRKFSRRLHPGNTVILQRNTYPYTRWLKVVRGNAKGTNYSSDTTSYYILYSALRNAQTFILL